MDSPINPFDPAAVAGTGFRPVSAGVPVPFEPTDDIPLDDSRWTTLVVIPAAAFEKVLLLTGSGTPIQHIVNVGTFGLLANGSRRVSPRQALSAFEAALTLAMANGQIAAEAMWQAGIPRAEIDDRITRFTAALHQASTSASPVFSVKPPSHAASERFDPASGHKPEAAVSASSWTDGAATTPAPPGSAN